MKIKYQKWLDKNICDLTGKNIIITGCNSGIGFYVALNLSYKNANIIMACRNKKKAEDAKNKILSFNPHAHLDILVLDLSSLISIDTFIHDFQQKYECFDVLIHNAGVYHLKQTYNQEGYEFVMATNYLGVYYLNEKILSLRRKNFETRIVFTTSIAHKWGNIDYDDFFCTKKYKYLKIYANSKLSVSRYMLYFSNQKIENLKVVASHPGVCSTNLLDPQKGGVSKSFSKFGNAFLKLFVHSANKASLSSVYAAASPNVHHQELYGPRGLFEISGYPKRRKFSKKAYHNLEKHIQYTKQLLHLEN